MNRHLQGGCQVPIACYAIHDTNLNEASLNDTSLEDGNDIWLRGLVGSPDGTHVIRDDIRGKATDAEKLGVTLAERFLEQGAGDILNKVYGD
jgi:hydroxymethylbilane synthase